MAWAWATAAASAGVLPSNSMAYASKSLSSISNHSFKPQLSSTPSMASAKPSILTFLCLCYLVDLMPPDGKLSLVGNQAPDFEAEAVFDQEFIKFSHLARVQTDRKSGGLGDLKSRICQGIALRGLFIIDKEGIIQHSTINNLAIGRSVDETPRTLQALQYVQENPDEVWPAGWKPGDRSSHEAESEA